MKWRREIDYHGSRAYGSQVVPGLFSLMIAWLGEIAKSKFRKLRSRPASPAVLLHDGQRKFTVLGSKTQRPADCPFPVKAQITDRDWRVFP